MVPELVKSTAYRYVAIDCREAIHVKAALFTILVKLLVICKHSLWSSMIREINAHSNGTLSADFSQYVYCRKLIGINS